MKRLLAGFTLMAVALAFTVGTTGCTKKEPTTDNVDKNKKPDKSNEMVKPEPKPKASGEPTTLEDPKKKDGQTPAPPPIPLPNEPKKKATDPAPPKLDLPPDEPKKKGASLDQPVRPGRDAVLRAALEPRLASS